MQRVLPQSNNPLLAQTPGSNQSSRYFKNCTIYNVGAIALSIMGTLGLFFGYYTLGSALCFLSLGCILYGTSQNQSSESRVTSNQSPPRPSSNHRNRLDSIARNQPQFASHISFKENELRRLDKLRSAPIKPIDSRAIGELATSQRATTALALTPQQQESKSRSEFKFDEAISQINKTTALTDWTCSKALKLIDLRGLDTMITEARKIQESFTE